MVTILFIFDIQTQICYNKQNILVQHMTKNRFIDCINATPNQLDRVLKKNVADPAKISKKKLQELQEAVFHSIENQHSQATALLLMHMYPTPQKRKQALVDIGVSIVHKNNLQTIAYFFNQYIEPITKTKRKPNLVWHKLFSQLIDKKHYTFAEKLVGQVSCKKDTTCFILRTAACFISAEHFQQLMDTSPNTTEDIIRKCYNNACQFGNKDVVLHLMKPVYSLTLEDHQNALMFSAQNGHTHVVEHLLTHTKTPLSHLVFYAAYDNNQHSFTTIETLHELFSIHRPKENAAWFHSNGNNTKIYALQAVLQKQLILKAIDNCTEQKPAVKRKM